MSDPEMADGARRFGAQDEQLFLAGDAEFGALETRAARRADSVADPHLLGSVSVRLTEAHLERSVFARAAIAGDDELLQGIRPERGRVGPPGVRVDAKYQRRCAPAPPETCTHRTG